MSRSRPSRPRRPCRTSPEPPKGSKEKDPLADFVWGTYGYSQDRRRYLPASQNLRPPFWRVWTYPGSVLTEFPPVMAEGKLFLLKNNGTRARDRQAHGQARVVAQSGHAGRRLPAYGNGRIFVTLLMRGKHNKGLVAALRPKDGKVLWSRPLASRSESSPVFDNDRIYFGAEDGSVYALRAADGGLRWKFKASGAVKGAPALADGKLFFGDYSGRVYAIREADGVKVWASGTKGGKFGLRAGSFYSSPAVAYGRVYIGNTDGKMYSFASDNGKLAWYKGTGSFVYASPAVAQVPGGKPSVFFGSYDGRFYALDARSGKVDLDPQLRRQDLRVGDRDRRHRLLLELRPQGHDGRRCPHRRHEVPHGPRRVQPRDLRRPHDLPDRASRRSTRSGRHA